MVSSVCLCCTQDDDGDALKQQGIMQNQNFSRDFQASHKVLHKQ